METLTAPPHPDNIGRVRKIKSINGDDVTFTIVDEIILPQGSGKLIYFQKLQHDPGKRLEYRLCYYMLGVKEARKGKWVFGQYALMIDAKDLKKVLQEAKKRKWKGVI